MAGGSGNHGTHGGPTTKIRDVENAILLLIYALALYPFNYCYLLVELVVKLLPWSVEYIRGVQTLQMSQYRDTDNNLQAASLSACASFS